MAARFVRLRADLRGRYDLRSGWGISGLDVKPMPDETERPNAYAYVVGEIRAGRLEQASKAEFDEAHPDIAGELGFKVEGTEDDAVPYQERSVRDRARVIHGKIKRRRATQQDEDSYEVDQARRKATIKAQQAQESRTKGKSSRAAAEAEDEAEEASGDHLRREANERSGAAGGLPSDLEDDTVDDVDVDDDDDDTDESDDSDGDDDEYEGMGKTALATEAKRRGLPHSGNAEQLRARLREDDDNDES